MKQTYKRLLSLLLAIVLFTTGLTPVLAANPQEQGGDVPALETLELERPVLPDKDFAFPGSPDIQALTPVLEPLVTLDSGIPPEANSRSRNAIVGTIVANPNDVAAMNAIIIKYQLPGISPWTEGVYPEAWHAYVQWEEIPGQGGRVVALNLSGKKIAGPLDVSQLTALRKLYSSNSQLTALSDNLPESLTELFINSNQLTALPKLPPSLEVLWCDGNQLKELPALPSSLTILYCESNQLTVLPALPPMLRDFRCDSNPIKVLSTLPQNLDILSVSNTELKKLPELPQSLLALNCNSNQLKNLPENLPQSLMNLYCAENQLKELPALPYGLTRLQLDSNQLTVLPALPQTLVVLSATNTGLKELPALPPAVEELYFNRNPIKVLPALPQSLKLLTVTRTKLEVLPALPPALEKLYCGETRLIKEIPTLPQSLTELAVESNQVTTLPTLPDSLEKLYCAWNELTELPALPQSLTKLVCNGNRLTVLPTLPNGLVWLHCEWNKLIELPALPSSLTELNCEYNQLTALDISNTPNLEELNCLNNQLTALNISNTPNLNMLDCRANHLAGKASIQGLAQATQLTEGDNFLFEPQTPPGFIYVPVASIERVVSTAAKVGTPYVLTGTVFPTDAYSRDITWSVNHDEGTGASIQGNILTTTAPGEVSVGATVKNGLAPGSDFLYIFFINVLENPRQITLEGSAAKETGAGFYAPGKLVTIHAGARAGYEFSGWKATGVTLYAPNSATTQFVMPDNDVTITANWRTNNGGGGSSGGGSSGGGGGGGSPVTDSTPAAPSTGTSIPSTVNSTDAVKQTAEAVASALKSSGVAKASVFVQNVDFVSPQTLRNMAAAAKKAGGTVQLVADTVMNGKVVARLYLDATQAANLVADIQLGVSVSQTSTAVTSAKFEKYYGNKFSVVSMAQAGSFGMPVGVAVKVDLTGLNTKMLRFCSYDKSTNKFYAITSPGYRVDEKGFLHFSTPLGGDIIITDAPLSTK